MSPQTLCVGGGNPKTGESSFGSYGRGISLSYVEGCGPNLDDEDADDFAAMRAALVDPARIPYEEIRRKHGLQ
jgi:hypothetical protein